MHKVLLGWRKQGWVILTSGPVNSGNNLVNAVTAHQGGLRKNPAKVVFVNMWSHTTEGGLCKKTTWRWSLQKDHKLHVGGPMKDIHGEIWMVQMNPGEIMDGQIKLTEVWAVQINTRVVWTAQMRSKVVWAVQINTRVVWTAQMISKVVCK